MTSGGYSKNYHDYWNYINQFGVAVLGSGSWGTVIAEKLSYSVDDVYLFFRNNLEALEVQKTREHKRYYPGFFLRQNIQAVSSLELIFSKKPKLIFWILPSSSTRQMAQQIAPLMTGEEWVIHGSKGFEGSTLKRISEVLEDELPTKRIGVLSGPNLAEEILKGEPAASVIASHFEDVQLAGASVFQRSKFKIELSQDLLGVEWAGILKNVLAIAAGCLDAIGFGWNARAMLIAQGLKEILHFGSVLGAKPESFLGLAGIGDLLATCSSERSRNFRLGKYVASGQSLHSALESLGGTAEGLNTARFLMQQKAKLGLGKMPVVEAVVAILDQGKNPKDELSRAIGA